MKFFFPKQIIQNLIYCGPGCGLVCEAYVLPQKIVVNLKSGWLILRNKFFGNVKRNIGENVEVTKIPNTFLEDFRWNLSKLWKNFVKFE